MITYFKRKSVQFWNKQGKNKGRSNREHSPPLFKMKMENNFIARLARQYEGKLLLRNEISLAETTFQKLLNNHYFTQIQSIKKNIISSSCTRCNDERLAKINCARCQTIHLYCRNCIRMGRVMECEPLYYWSGNHYIWPKHENPLTWIGTLTKAQQIAAHKVVENVKKSGEILVWAVTGSGKTEMLFPGITTALQMGKRICIATPRADVVRELLPRFQTAFSSIHIQGLYSGSKDNDGTAQLIIATTHQLFRYCHAFDVLVIDEIDAFPYHHDTSLQFAANRAAKLAASQIYLTATPRKQLKKRVTTKKIEYVFVPIRFHGYPLPIPKMIYCPALKRHLGTNNLPKQFANWLSTREKQTRQLLIFVPTIRLATSLQQAISNLLIQQNHIEYPNQIISVHAEDKEREKKIMLFRKKKLFSLITTTILERGVTFPAIDVAVLDAGHDVFDAAALVQIAGRAGRSPIDPTGEVVFFHDGKTDAMVHAQGEMMKMNKRREKLIVRHQ